MKLILSILALILMSSLRAQTFTYQDSTFSLGQSKTLAPFTIALDCEYIACNSDIIDSLVNFLRTHRELSVEIENHTDTRGSEQYNIEYSQKLADEIVKYLIQNGIAKNRLSAKGLGETKPIHTDQEIREMDQAIDQELAHLKNRRVVVKITKIKKSKNRPKPVK